MTRSRFFLPRVSGGGGPSCAARWWKGRRTQRFTFVERVSSSPAPLPPRCFAAWSPSPALGSPQNSHANFVGRPCAGEEDEVRTRLLPRPHHALPCSSAASLGSPR